jgi:hypothetical protein
MTYVCHTEERQAMATKEKISKRPRVTKITTMRFPPDIMQRIDVVAAEQERSRTWIIEKILRDYLSRSAGDLKSVFE